MKVVNIIEEGRYGGPHNRIINVAIELKKYNVITEVILPKNESDVFKGRLKESNITFIEVEMSRPTIEFVNLFKFIFFFPLETYRLYKQLGKLQFDVVHINGTHQIKGVLACIFSKSKFIWHINDQQFPWLIKKTFSILARFSRGFLFSSVQCKKFYSDVFDSSIAQNVSISRPPINTLEFLNQRKLGVGNEINIITVANINPVKGIETLIRAAQLVIDKLNRTNRVCYFNIFGTIQKSQEKYVALLKEMIKHKNLEKNIFLHGYEANIKVRLEESDIFLCTSTNETGPIALFEGMAMNLPFVTTDVGDVRELNDISKGGIVCNVNDHIAISEAIILLIENRELYSQMTNNARSIAVELLDVSIAAKAHLKVYQKAI